MHRALLLLHCRRSVYPPVLAAARSVLVKGPRVDGPSHLSTIDEPFDTPIGALLRENNSFSSCRQHSHVALVGGLTFSAGAHLAVSDALSAQAKCRPICKERPLRSLLCNCNSLSRRNLSARSFVLVQKRAHTHNVKIRLAAPKGCMQCREGLRMSFCDIFGASREVQAVPSQCLRHFC